MPIGCHLWKRVAHPFLLHRNLLAGNGSGGYDADVRLWCVCPAALSKTRLEGPLLGLRLKPLGFPVNWPSDMTSAACRGWYRWRWPIRSCMSLVFDMWTGPTRASCDTSVFLSISHLQTIDDRKTKPGVRHFASRRAPGSIFSCQVIVQSTASIYLLISLSFFIFVFFPFGTGL
jgi:hypothetical protein